jgi:hypothetical protein
LVRLTAQATIGRAGPSAAAANNAFTDHLSAFVEYNHYDFGTERITLNPQFSFLPTAFVDIEDTDNVIRAGINLRIGRP